MVTRDDEHGVPGGNAACHRRRGRLILLTWPPLYFPAPFRCWRCLRQVMHVLAVFSIFLSYQACLYDCEVIAADPALTARIEAEFDSLRRFLPIS